MSSHRRVSASFLLALLVVGFLALLGIVGMTIWLGEKVSVYSSEAMEARDTRIAAVELRSAVQVAESSQRGFLYTGNEIYLAPYSTGKAAAERQLDIVNKGLASYPETKVSVERLSAILQEKFDEMDSTISLKRERKDEEALSIMRTNRGKALADEANVFFSGIIRAADARLTKGLSEQEANVALLRVMSILGGIVIVVVISTALTALLRYTRQLKLVRDEVTLLNESLEKRVEERTDELARANAEIQRFAHVITHDLSAPLVSIAGFSSDLEDTVKSLQAYVEHTKDMALDKGLAQQAHGAAMTDLPEALGFIRSSAKKMDGLIEAILKLLRQGKPVLKPERIDLHKMIKESFAAIQHQLSSAESEIALQLDAPALVIDRLSLEQVFGNLFDNAVKYRSKDRALRITVRSHAVLDAVHIEVEDNGRGIAAHDLERIFEPFRRAGEQDQQGEGVGLAHVQTIVRKLGGTVTVSSVLTRGSIFRIVLPASPAESRLA